jgi:hypothetical protein
MEVATASSAGDTSTGAGVAVAAAAVAAGGAAAGEVERRYAVAKDAHEYLLSRAQGEGGVEGVAAIGLGSDEGPSGRASSTSSSSSSAAGSFQRGLSGSELYSLPVSMQRLALRATRLATELEPVAPAAAASSPPFLAVGSPVDGSSYPADGGEEAMRGIREELLRLYQEVRSEGHFKDRGKEK